MRNLKPVAVMWGRRRFATARAAVRAPTFGHHSIPHVWTSHEKQYRHRMGIKWIDDYRAHTHAMGNWYIKNTHIARRLIKKEIDFIHFNRLHIMKPLLFLCRFSLIRHVRFIASSEYRISCGSLTCTQSVLGTTVEFVYTQYGWMTQKMNFSLKNVAYFSFADVSHRVDAWKNCLTAQKC